MNSITSRPMMLSSIPRILTENVRFFRTRLLGGEVLFDQCPKPHKPSILTNYITDTVRVVRSLDQKDKFINDEIHQIVMPYPKKGLLSATFIMLFEKGHVEKEDWHFHDGDGNGQVGNRIVELLPLVAFKLEVASHYNEKTKQFSHRDSIVLPPYYRGVASIPKEVWHRFLPAEPTDNLPEGAILALATSTHPEESISRLCISADGYTPEGQNNMRKETTTLEDYLRRQVK